MKKQLLLIALAFYSLFCHAQNYQCIQNSVKHYFINSQNYLRGICIDSVQTFGDTTVYYPYQVGNSYLDTITGGWLGKKVTQLSDGTFFFDDMWGDTITVKTQAGPSDSWLFYSDTTNHTYIATLTAIDTMTILDSLDSVKIITIQSYHEGQNNTNDPLNGYQLVLSKRNGFAKAFDLYTFPYYSHSGDILYDRYINVGGTMPFNIVNYHNPTSLEMYGSLNVGDMFAGSQGGPVTCYESAGYNHYDSIIAKVVIDSFHINYTIHHVINGSSYTVPWGSSTGTYGYFSGEYYDTLRIDTSAVFLKLMPEQRGTDPYAYFYFPSDTTFCYSSPAYKCLNTFQFEGCEFEADFKQGLLPTYDSTICSYPCGIDGLPETTNDIMYYALINGHSCNDVILPPLSVNTPFIADDIKIFPNPVENELNISTTQTIHQVIVYNMLGQTMYNQQFNSEKVQLDISNLAAGMYFLKVNGEAVQKFVKQ